MLGHTKYALSSLTVASRQKCWSLLAAGLPAATVPSAARLSDSATCNMGSKEIVAERVSSCAVAVLNRPRVLNALNLSMVKGLADLYREWARPDNGIHCILLKGAGKKAFCAGGDVKSIVAEARKGNPKAAIDFFQSEYTLNYLISQLPKPHIAIMDRITMGGGAGVAMHGHFRVATERTVFAMPECGIGLFPDVGASRFLNSMPYRTGRYLALTGARLKGAEVRVLALATHFILSDNLPILEQRLEALGARAEDASVVDAVLKDMEDTSFHRSMGEFHSKMLATRLLLEQSSMENVIAALKGHEGEHKEFCDGILDAFKRNSPLSMKIVFEQLARSRYWELDECLEMEFMLAQRFSQGEADFWEGVRAVLIDKDQKPNWRYPSVEEVPDDIVKGYFEQREDLKSLNLRPQSKM